MAKPESADECISLACSIQSLKTRKLLILSNSKSRPHRSRYGYRVSNFDVAYSQNAMNFMKSSGFLLLGTLEISCVCLRGNRLHDVRFRLSRLCLYAVLNLAPEGLVLLAPCCASWGAPNRGTSKRSVINPHGHQAYAYVAEANQCVSRSLGCIYRISPIHSPEHALWLPRMVLLILLVLAKNAFFAVEQPAQSLMFMHERWQLLSNRICYDSVQQLHAIESKSCGSNRSPAYRSPRCKSQGVLHQILDAAARRLLPQTNHCGEQSANYWIAEQGTPSEEKKTNRNNQDTSLLGCMVYRHVRGSFLS